jgi:hypothetical protein
MSDSKKCVEELPCQLTEDEMLDRSRKLAGMHQQQLEIEDKKKQAMNEFTARLKKVSGDIHYTSNVISSGKEARNVECRLDYFWEEGRKVLIRLDTGEAVSDEVIPDYERQQHMDFVERENGKVAEEAANKEWIEPEEAEEAGPEVCNDCGSTGDEHSDDCPTLSEEVAEEEEPEPVEPEGTEETEEEPGQDETGDEVPEPEEPVEEEQPEPEADEESCFGQFDPDDETCQECSQSADCFEETPESKAEPTEEKGEEDPDLPPRHKCAKCEGFFEEPKDNEDEDDTTSCPLCGDKNWM